MGEEVATSHFSHADFARFQSRLREETDLLRRWFAEARFSAGRPVAGFELEVWLVDGQGQPAPVNEGFLARLGDPLVVRELAQFNVEINSTPRLLTAGVLRLMRHELEQVWARCRDCAHDLGADLLMIGILPTVTESALNLAHMSPLARYRALNEQILRLRRGEPVVLDIQGRDHLVTTHRDVMLESAATSLQMHLQVPQAEAVRFYNAAQIVSAPMVAVAANAAYLFGMDLWDDTRIPLFEQSIAVPGLRNGSPPAVPRVTFGSGYALESLWECYLENLERYAVLLPMVFDSDSSEFHHVRLHNGTIWRWNRPLIGVDEAGPHLRIEHRVASAGPSIADVVANIAFYYGLVHALAEDSPAPETRLPFPRARANFYHAARHGLDAPVTWLNGREVALRSLVLEELIPMARESLQALGVDGGDVASYLGIMEERLRSGRTGAAWQRGFVARHGPDMQALVSAYSDHQRSGRPVHEWSI
jgi:gamma-glutamyl:cysteine ligase YbdK (ATP-grasp superfamily)